MTKKTNHDHYKAQRDKQDALKTKAMKSLTVDQLNAIKETHKTISNCLMMIRDCNDLYMSDKYRSLHSAIICVTLTRTL